MVKTITIAILIIGTLIGLLNWLCSKCFDDHDEDMDYNNNYAVIKCPHLGDKTQKVVDSCVTCETVHTICDDCGMVLKETLEC